MSNSTNQFADALARLDAEIAEAEARLADLRVTRKGAEAFLRYVNVDAADTFTMTEGITFSAESPPRFVTRNSPSESVLSVFEGRSPSDVLLLDDIEKALIAKGVELDRQKIRNGIHYAVRKGFLEKAASRGAWRLAPTNAEAPAVTGASDTEEPSSDSSLQEGDSGGTETLHGHDGLALDAPDHRGGGLSSSAIGGGN